MHSKPQRSGDQKVGSDPLHSCEEEQNSRVLRSLATTMDALVPRGEAIHLVGHFLFYRDMILQSNGGSVPSNKARIVQLDALKASPALFHQHPSSLVSSARGPSARLVLPLPSLWQ